MLALMRKEGERIFIGNDIRVQVLTLKGKSVILGFDAPREVPIFREELLDKVEMKNTEPKTEDSPQDLRDRIAYLKGINQGYIELLEDRNAQIDELTRINAAQQKTIDCLRGPE